MLKIKSIILLIEESNKQMKFNRLQLLLKLLIEEDTKELNLMKISIIQLQKLIHEYKPSPGLTCMLK